MACDDVLSLQDLQTAKKHDIFHAEVITGKVGGTGADIDTATNQVTGQLQTTLPKTLRDVGVKRVGDFTSGCTVTERNQGVLEVGGSVYVWIGVIPPGGKIVPPSSTPSGTGGISPQGGWLDIGDASLRGELLAGSMKIREGLFSLRDFVSVKDFGAKGDGVTDDTLSIQRAINYAATNCRILRIPVGTYIISETLVVDVPLSGDGSIIIEGERKLTVIKQTGINKDVMHFSSINFILHSGIRDLTFISSATSGNGVVIKYGLGDCFFENIEMEIHNRGKACWVGNFTESGAGIYTTRWIGGTWKLAENSTSSGFDIKLPTSYFNSNVIDGVTCYNASQTQFFKFTNIGDRAHLNSFKNICFEVCRGGGFYYEAFSGCLFENIGFYDALGDNTYHANLMHGAQGSGPANSFKNTFINISRIGDSLANGVYDFYLESGDDGVYINCASRPSTGSRYHFADKPTTVIGSLPTLSILTGDKNLTIISPISGITFAGAQNRSPLKYYDRGSWTAKLAGYGSSPAIPVTTIGSWVRIGDVVTISAKFDGVNTIGASGSIAILGCPFTSSVNGQIGNVSHVGITANTSPLVAYITNTSTDILLVMQSNHSSGVVFGSTGAGKSLCVTMTIIVDQ